MQKTHKLVGFLLMTMSVTAMTYLFISILF